MPVSSSLALYRWTLREFKSLPVSCRQYYLRMARSSMNSHISTRDPARIIALQEKGIMQVEWLLNKYTGKKPSSPPPAATGV